MTSPVAQVDDLSTVMSRIASLQQMLNGLQKSPATKADFSTVLASATTDASTPTTGTPGMAAMSGTTATTSVQPLSSGGSLTGADVVADASTYIGVPYVFAGTTRQGLDCSGLVQRVYSDLGISLPRIAADQAKVGTPIDSLADAKPGDVLAFGNPAYHVAIYIGNGEMIAAPEPGDHVKVQKVYETPSTIRRIIPSSSGDSATGAVSPAVAASSLPGRSAAVMAFEPQFAAAERKYGLPAGMLSAVAQQESGGNINAVSPAGALGLMQFMPGTAAGLGVNPYDPAQAIDGAGRLLARNLSIFHGSVPLALAAYNAGAGAVQQYGGVPPYAETQNYVRRITAMMGLSS